MISVSRLPKPLVPVRLAAWARTAGTWLRPALKIRSIWPVITPAGRAALLVAAGAWLLGLRLGWQELFLAAACAAIALVLAIGFVLGRPTLETGLELKPGQGHRGDAGRLAWWLPTRPGPGCAR